MKKFGVSVWLVLAFVSNLYAQQRFTVSGKVKDGNTKEELIGATVVVKGSGKGTNTGLDGNYTLSLPKGSYVLEYSYLGYQQVSKTVNLSDNVKLDVALFEDKINLEEVVVTGKRDDANVKSMEMSVNKLDIKQIEKMPALVGEVDIIRSIQTLPGVTTVGEGASGFNVRGGGADQNLILLDDAPIYNSHHLFGMFSIFNPDAVKSVSLLKGGIPAPYGGRLSSLLDIHMKEANPERFAMQGGIGAVFSRLTLETPVVKNKGGIIVSGRRSYIDVLAKPFLNEDLSGASFYFYDLSLKADYQIDDKNKLFLSGYYGRDVFGTEFFFKYGNATSTLRWNHLFSEKLVSNLTLFVSNYDYNLGVGDIVEDGFDWKSRILNYSVKPEFTWFANAKNTVTFGVQSMFYDFMPADFVFASGGTTSSISMTDRFALENAIYIGNEQEVNSRLGFSYGLRYSHFNYLGKISYGLSEGPQGRRRDPVNLEFHDGLKNIQGYGNLEPRFALKYELSPSASIKASYNRMAQYLHQLSNTAATTPLDLWTPSTQNILPQLADQVAVGLFKNFNENMFETSMEVYYKKLHNQFDYIDNADVFANDFFEGDLLRGRGRAFGSEWYIHKKTGKLTGWISYTLSRTERLIEGINEDRWYFNRYDRPHNLNVVSTYELSQRWSVSANFVYASGTPATFPTNRIIVNGWAVPHNFENRRANYRVPAFHRLDLAATLEGKKVPGRRWDSSWVFSVYNVYNRRNPFSIFFQPNDLVPLETQTIRYSIIGSFVPAITYNFKF
jgi:hypothetical protein